MMCLKEIGMCAKNQITILGSTYNIIGGHLYDHLLSTRILHFVNELDIYTSFANYEANGYGLNLDLLPTSY